MDNGFAIFVPVEGGQLSVMSPSADTREDENSVKL